MDRHCVCRSESSRAGSWEMILIDRIRQQIQHDLTSSPGPLPLLHVHADVDVQALHVQERTMAGSWVQVILIDRIRQQIQHVLKDSQRSLSLNMYLTTNLACPQRVTRATATLTCACRCRCARQIDNYEQNRHIHLQAHLQAHLQHLHLHLHLHRHLHLHLHLQLH